MISDELCRNKKLKWATFTGCDLDQNQSWVHYFHFTGAPASSAMEKVREPQLRFVRITVFFGGFSHGVPIMVQSKPKKTG